MFAKARTLLYTAALTTLALLPSAANATGLFDTIGTSVQTATTGWFSQAQAYANDIFAALVALEVVWLAITWLISRKTLDEIVPALIRKVMVLGFFMALLANAGTWLPLIVSSFTSAGSNIAHVPTLSPSTLLDEGDAMAAGIMTGDFSGMAAFGVTVPPIPSPTTCGINPLCVGASIINAPANLLAALIKFIVDLIFAGITWVAFLLMALDLLVTQIEAYVILGVGVFFFGFGGSRWTTKFADGILNYAVSVGVKLMALYLVLGTLILAVIPAVLSEMAAASGVNSPMAGLGTLLPAAAGIMLTLMLSKAIPSKAQSMLSGGANLSGAHAVAAGVGAGTAAAVVGGVVGGALGAGASKAIGAARMAFGGSVSGGSGAGSPGTPGAGGVQAAGQAAGQGVKAATQAAGSGLQTAGAAISAIPVPGVAQVAGAVVNATGTATQVAGKAAGTAVEQGAKAADKGVKAAGESMAGSSQDARTQTASAPAGGSSAPALKPANSGSQGGVLSKLAGMTKNAGNTASNLGQNPHGGVQASHVSTSHGSD